MEILWKKESNKDGALYVDVLKDVNENHAEAPYVSSKHKNNKMASKLTDYGNQNFLQKNYLAAVNYYTESLCFCEKGSENISPAYANRSSCFFMLKLYRKCLADIELAIGAKCPIPDLLKRKEHCLKCMKTDHPIEDFSPQLSFEEDERFLGMANVIEIKYNEEFGRQITAKCDIDVGNFILIEKSFVTTSIITDWKFCNYCLNRVTNLIPCNGCTYAMYCDSTCLESDIFHETECGILITDSGSIPQITQHTQRSIITAINIFPTIEDLMEFVEDAVRDKSNKVPSSILDNKSKYYSFLQLHIYQPALEHDFPDNLQIINRVYHNILSFSSLKEKFDTERKQRFLMHLIGYHFSIAMTNGFFGGKTSYNYIIQSYFNHSCSPNVGNYVNRQKMFCIAIRPIKKGEQLFISYTSEDNTVIRQEHIYQTWGIQCKCEKCEPCLQSISDEEKLFPCINTDLDVILNAMKDESYKTCQTKLLMIKEMHISFLRKYGRLHWNDKIELVKKYFMEVLCLESSWISND